MTARKVWANNRMRLLRKLMRSQALTNENAESRTGAALQCSDHWLETTSASGHSTFQMIVTYWKLSGITILMDEGLYLWTS